jgi:hypothetical protein
VAHALPDFLCSSLTVWGEASSSGKTLHARNLDFFVDPGGVFGEEHLVKIYSSSEEGGARLLSVSVPGLVGCISCFTEEGAGVTIHNVDGIESSTPYQHVPRVLTARAALASSQYAAQPVAAAEDVIESCPQLMGDNFHFFFPCSGPGCTGGAVFELDGVTDNVDGQVTVRMPGEHDGGLNTTDAVVCTNHFLKRSTDGENYADYAISESSSSRFQSVVDGINSALSSGGLDAEGARAIMASVDRAEPGFGTMHTAIMDTGEMKLYLYVMPDVNTPAPEAEPVILDFRDLFSRLP